jgi:hypothetical protein
MTLSAPGILSVFRMLDHLQHRPVVTHGDKMMGHQASDTAFDTEQRLRVLAFVGCEQREGA